MVQEYDLGNVRGAQGPPGPAGPQGPAGAVGPTPHITVGNTLIAASRQCSNRQPPRGESGQRPDF